MNKRYAPKYALNSRPKGDYWIILLKCLGWILLGAAAGYVFFYFFSEFSAGLVDRYKFLQGLFGIRHYEETARYLAVILAILMGNTVSTVAYFVLGYFRMLIPLSIITGFLMIVLLFTGAFNRQMPFPPLEVIILFSIEAFYRCLALTTGEHLYRNKLAKKPVFIVSVILVFILLIGAAFYEIYQIFGYIF